MSAEVLPITPARRANRARVQLPPKLVPVFTPKRGDLRYRGAYGGRGSGKSFNFAKMAAIYGVAEPLRILCTREIQDSIKESFHAELRAAIASEPWLTAAYDVGVDYLKSRINDTVFLFKGLRHNIGSLKSLAKIDICIVEEAEDVPEASWLALEPTIRSPRSEIWVLWNPKTQGSPVDARFRNAEFGPPPRSCIVEMNYLDNPWFPVELEEQRQTQYARLDRETYRWIWDGAYWKSSSASIMRGKWVEEVREPDPATWHGPYYGLDFGFANDPTAGIECWISPDETELYISRESGGKAWELDFTATNLLADIPGMEKSVVVADSARPESISYLRRPRDARGLAKKHLARIEGAQKGAGSVEDGIAFIRSFAKVVINPECKRTVSEFELYSYKVDRFTGEVTTTIVDAHNHWIDALRYALEKVMRSRSVVGLLAPPAAVGRGR